MDLHAKTNFLLQQGFESPSAATCPVQYEALLFQPRIVAGILLVATLTQSSILFFVLAGLLWWCALFPKLNVFDALQDLIARTRGGAGRPGPAPPPRRFAQFLAGLFSVAIGSALWSNQMITAWILTAVFATAVIALAFGGFCFGSFVYHVIRGRLGFARRTLPWARNDPGV